MDALCPVEGLKRRSITSDEKGHKIGKEGRSIETPCQRFLFYRRGPFFIQDVPPGGLGDRFAAQHPASRLRHREVHGRGRHLQVLPQLQRHPADLLRLHQLLRLQAQEHVERGAKAGLFFTFFYTEPSVLYLFFYFPRLATRSTSSRPW